MLWQRHPKALERFDALERALGTAFRDRELLFEALSHRSAISELSESLGCDVPLAWNERLEFLGDSVLSLAISRRLMMRAEARDEGTLSRWRAALVNEDSLAEVARGLFLGEALVLGRSADLTGGRERASMLADAVEALIGAVYLDAGSEHADALVGRLYAKRIDAGVPAGAMGDFKTMLQEWTQERVKVVPDYVLVGESGPDHDKRFEVAVCLGGKELGRGVGASKKRASQEAARQALSRLSQDDGQISLS